MPDEIHPPLAVTSETIVIHRGGLPDVHTLEAVPHVHCEDAREGRFAIHALPGDTPRGLVDLGLTYLALGLALHEKASYAWDQVWTNPPGHVHAEDVGNENHDRD